MVGPVVPVPVPQVILDALVSATVSTSAQRGTPSGFESNFTLSTSSPLHTIFLLTGLAAAGPAGDPDRHNQRHSRRSGGRSHPQQEVSPGPDAGHSTLKITGVDLTAVMDLIPFDGLPYPAMPPEGACC